MKKKLLWIGLFIFVIVFINVIILLTNKDNQKVEETPVKRETKVVNRIYCTYTDEEEIEYSMDLSLENNVLITKTDEMKWEDGTKEFCEYYKKREEVYNSITGIVDVVNCSIEVDGDGSRKTVYQFDTLDRVEARILELKYINEDNTFDFEGYETYRKNEGYRCVES